MMTHSVMYFRRAGKIFGPFSECFPLPEQHPTLLPSPSLVLQVDNQRTSDEAYRSMFL